MRCTLHSYVAARFYNRKSIWCWMTISVTAVAGCARYCSRWAAMSRKFFLKSNKNVYENKFLGHFIMPIHCCVCINMCVWAWASVFAVLNADLLCTINTLFMCGFLVWFVKRFFCCRCSCCHSCRCSYCLFTHNCCSLVLFSAFLDIVFHAAATTLPSYISHLNHFHLLESTPNRAREEEHNAEHNKRKSSDNEIV